MRTPPRTAKAATARKTKGLRAGIVAVIRSASYPMIVVAAAPDCRRLDRGASERLLRPSSCTAIVSAAMVC